MYPKLAVVLSSLFAATAVAQSTSSVICVAGQCVQGFFNTTIGATLSASGAPTSLHLLPGQYTSTTNPQLLHTLLTSSSSSLTPSPGFESASLSSLPLNLNLAPGLAIYSQSLYSGQAAFSQLPSTPINNSTIPLSASSIALSNNIWAAVVSGSSNNRVILWDSIPDVSQLPTGASSSLSLTDIQSSACSPPCSGSGVCSASGTCTCPTGFTGQSCESCAQGFFGPNCQPCPTGCGSCDQGISGSGRCLTPVVTNAPSTCNCLNGQCGTNGQCACNPGWVTADNGTACAKCAPGFFQTSTGDCQVCQLGCDQCTDGTATCIACKQGFSQNANDRTKCDPLPAVTTGGVRCPDGSFSAGSQCSPCSPSCRTCNGPSSNNCVLCAAGTFLFNGNCVSADQNGVCQGTNGMIADNNKNECDTCGAKCTSCGIPNFNVASTVNELQCTGCLPGFVLSQGECVESCPSGTFVSPTDNLTCTPCSSSCSTCVGAADFCLSCASGLQASSGQCVATCPSDTFNASGSCLKCHPDCASCSGPSFNQCSTCPSDRPVLTNGRCLPTCSKSQYFDTTSSTCQSCDSSCSSCSGPGAENCLACSSATQVLRAGSCVSANCNGATNVIPGLGVCLSELVRVNPTGTGTAAPLPTITGLTDPTTIEKRRPLEWWQILLMALGCAFIFLMILMCWRRKARKQRAKRTAMFASAKRLDNPRTWRQRLVEFGEKFFGHKTRLYGKQQQPEVLPVAFNDYSSYHSRSGSLAGPPGDIKMNKITKPRFEIDKKSKSTKRETVDDVNELIDSYGYSIRSRTSRAPSTLPDRDNRLRHQLRRVEQDSIYSEITGNTRHTPEPRQPLRRNVSEASRLSRSTISSGRTRVVTKEGVLVDLEDEAGKRVPPLPLQMADTGVGQSRNGYTRPTEAEAYVQSVRPQLGIVPNPAITPISTGLGGTPFLGMPIQVTLTPNTAMGQGSYWLAPLSHQQQPGLQAMQQPLESYDTVVLQPTHTGSSSSSRNPFRQGTN